MAILGINRGVKAKHKNRLSNLENKPSPRNNINNELRKLKKLYDDGAINKKEFNLAKKKLLS